MVLSSLNHRVLQSQFLNEQSIRFIQLGKLHGLTAWNEEIQTKVGCLTFLVNGHVLYCGDMERSKGRGVYGNQDTVMSFINIELALF